jgi:hypothetical protein
LIGFIGMTEVMPCYKTSMVEFVFKLNAAVVLPRHWDGF